MNELCTIDESERKRNGAYYTPEYAVRSLVRWAVRRPTDRLLDPACGDGRFLNMHRNSVGVEHDHRAHELIHASARTPRIHKADFFDWATNTRERFECAAGNPPFIRYQRFSGETRKRALRICAAHGADITSLASSWAPFIIATATLLKPGGRMAFVVPAEIGHATYSRPVLRFLADRFSLVQIVGVRRRMFLGLSEDCWLLFTDGYGGQTNTFVLSQLDQFGYMPRPPCVTERISLRDWEAWNFRLRPFLLGREVRGIYRRAADDIHGRRLGDVADVGIGYVTGANDFFHLRPSQAKAAGISRCWLHPSVRNSKSLPRTAVTAETVRNWSGNDESVLLLRLSASGKLPASIRAYLDSAEGQQAREAYKCRMREPWYVVPGVQVPDAFLSYMSNVHPILVANPAGCVCTNSVHAVRLKHRSKVSSLQRLWNRPLTKLSCEIEGHPLGGGLLKLEPREASRVLLANAPPKSHRERRLILEGIGTLQAWRHHE